MTESKGRDIMAVYHFYSGEVIEQKYVATHLETYFDDATHSTKLYPTKDARLPPLEGIKFLTLDNGVIRQTKDIEKVVWSYC